MCVVVDSADGYRVDTVLTYVLLLAVLTAIEYRLCASLAQRHMEQKHKDNVKNKMLQNLEAGIVLGGTV